MCPSGDDAFARKAAQKEQQKAASEAARPVFTNDFKLQSGQTAVVRFLEQGTDLTFADVHRVPFVSKAGKTYARNFVCLNLEDDDTPCAGCSHFNDDVSKRKTIGYVNLIWRNAPVFQKDEQGRMVKGPDNRFVVIGAEDQIALWNPSWTTFSMLKAKDGKFKGLMNWEWEVKREGSTMNDTKWFVDPDDPAAGATPMTIADMSLAEKKYDLKALIKPLEYATLAQAISRGAFAGDGPQPTFDRGQYAPNAASTFEDGPSVRSSAFTR